MVDGPVENGLMSSDATATSVTDGAVWWAVARQSVDHVGLIERNGIIAPARAYLSWHRAC